mmetsp:Transcript_49444/g.127600  ORF Transcript_49444/g.127600 Transcript_49444/m.127600 type:complete len:363 (-) Transcript_49444:216-1304(-)
MFGRSSFKARNVAVDGSNAFDREVPDPSQVHLLICALDYKGTSCPLTCTLDGNNMQALARACGVQDMEVMYDNQCTKENVAERIRQMAQRCSDDDYFIFYYSGHGTSMEDEDGDEEDGKDEALCFVGPQGQLSGDYFMSDDDFAELLTEEIPESTRIIIMTDCCHSGTIGDLDKECWEGREVVSMSGCTDSQTSGDIGKGGIFTHSLLLAIEKITKSGTDEFSVGLLYNATVHEDDKVFKSAQDIQLESPPGFMPNQMAWPLVPRGEYRSPLSQVTEAAASSPGGGGGGGGDGPMGGKIDLAQILAQNPQLAAQLGIKPEMIPFMQGLGGQMLEHGPEYMELLQQFGAGGQCVRLLQQCSIQ